MKLSDFLKQQGDTPQGKSTYQAFIDNFDKDYDAESFRKDEKGSIGGAFQWDICPEDLEFWDIADNKWQEVPDPENDMLWLLDGKEPPQEADVEDELEERRRKEAVTPTEQTPILPIGTNQLLDTEETKELDEAAKAIDPFGYYENMGKTTKQEKQPVSLFNSTSDGYSLQAEMFGDGSIMITGAGTIPHKKETTSYILYDEVADKDSGCGQVDSKRKQIGGDHYAGHNNGGNTDYYKLPEGATELQDIIEHKKMHWNIANMFKALYRMGQQDHSSIERDLNKIEYFLKRHKELLRKDKL